MNIKIIPVDITTLKVDAIVNAANNAMCGGGGVDGAIHKAAGLQLLAECRTLGRCETGDAKITKGYNLPAQYIIHTVGPVWHGGHKYEANLLSLCYQNCLRIAEQNNITSLAFPAISCGAYRFPIDKACDIAIAEIMKTKETQESKINNIILTCFEHKIETALKRSLREYVSKSR